MRMALVNGELKGKDKKALLTYLNSLDTKTGDWLKTNFETITTELKEIKQCIKVNGKENSNGEK
jgi:hypothetical protein